MLSEEIAYGYHFMAEHYHGADYIELYNLVSDKESIDWYIAYDPTRIDYIQGLDLALSAAEQDENDLLYIPVLTLLRATIGNLVMPLPVAFLETMTRLGMGDKAIALAQLHADLLTQCKALCSIARVYWELIERIKALEALDLAQNKAGSIRNISRRCEALFYISSTRFQIQKIAFASMEALRRAEDVATEATLDDSAHAQRVEALCGLAKNYFERGDSKSGLETLNRANSVVSSIAENVTRFETMRQLSLASIEAGDDKLTEKFFTAAYEIGQSIGDDIIRSGALSRLALIKLESGDRQFAIRMLKDAGGSLDSLECLQLERRLYAKSGFNANHILYQQLYIEAARRIIHECWETNDQKGVFEIWPDGMEGYKEIEGLVEEEDTVVNPAIQAETTNAFSRQDVDSKIERLKSLAFIAGCRNNLTLIKQAASEAELLSRKGCSYKDKSMILRICFRAAHLLRQTRKSIFGLHGIVKLDVLLEGLIGLQILYPEKAIDICNIIFRENTFGRNTKAALTPFISSYLLLFPSLTTKAKFHHRVSKIFERITKQDLGSEGLVGLIAFHTVSGNFERVHELFDELDESVDRSELLKLLIMHTVEQNNIEVTISLIRKIQKIETRSEILTIISKRLDGLQKEQAKNILNCLIPFVFDVVVEGGIDQDEFMQRLISEKARISSIDEGLQVAKKQGASFFLSTLILLNDITIAADDIKTAKRLLTEIDAANVFIASGLPIDRKYAIDLLTTLSAQWAKKSINTKSDVKHKPWRRLAGIANHSACLLINSAPLTVKDWDSALHSFTSAQYRLAQAYEGRIASTYSQNAKFILNIFRQEHERRSYRSRLHTYRYKFTSLLHNETLIAVACTQAECAPKWMILSDAPWSYTLALIGDKICLALAYVWIAEIIKRKSKAKASRWICCITEFIALFKRKTPNRSNEKDMSEQLHILSENMIQKAMELIEEHLKNLVFEYNHSNNIFEAGWSEFPSPFANLILSLSHAKKFAEIQSIAEKARNNPMAAALIAQTASEVASMGDFSLARSLLNNSVRPLQKSIALTCLADEFLNKEPAKAENYILDAIGFLWESSTPRLTLYAISNVLKRFSKELQKRAFISILQQSKEKGRKQTIAALTDLSKVMGQVLLPHQMVEAVELILKNQLMWSFKEKVQLSEDKAVDIDKCTRFDKPGKRLSWTAGIWLQVFLDNLKSMSKIILLGSAIWLAVLGKWSVIAKGLTAIFIAKYVIKICIGLYSNLLVHALIRLSNLVTRYIINSLACIVPITIIFAWCYLSFSYFLNIEYTGNHLPMVFWSYGLAVIPINHIFLSYPDNIFALIEVFCAQLACIITVLMYLMHFQTALHIMYLFMPIMIILWIIETLLLRHSRLFQIIQFEKQAGRSF